MKKQNHSLKVAAVTGILGTVFCVCLLSLTSYAFFTASVTSTPSRVETSTYTLSMEFDPSDEVTLNPDHSYTLANGTYTVTLDAVGTATTGFAKFKINGQEYFSKQIYNVSSIGGNAVAQEVTFTLECEVETKLEFDYQWGYHAVTEENEAYVIGDSLTVNWSAT